MVYEYVICGLNVSKGGSRRAFVTHRGYLRLKEDPVFIRAPSGLVDRSAVVS